MKKTLYFDKINFNYPNLSFEYIYSDQHYNITLPLNHVKEESFKKIESKFLNYIFFHIGISLSPHLFNLEDFDEIVLRPFRLDDYSRSFFSNYLQKGLGEFRYRNNLDLLKKIEITNAENAQKYQPNINKKFKERILLLCGGGKDSLIAGKIIESLPFDFSWFIVNPIRHRVDLAEKINNKIFLSGKLLIDQKIKNEAKFKGHKPLSAYLAFSGVLFANLFNYKYICVGNEKSANFENVTVDGFAVNHQYSKSYEFEKNFFDYVRKNISKDIHYFSIVRPLYDLQLGKIFSHYKDFYKIFISCNDNQKKSNWCNVCAKCAFTFLIMYPFISEEELIAIFGENLFDKKVIRDWIKDMCVSEVRPFECIGTKDECRYALYLCLNKKDGILQKKEYQQELNEFVGKLDLEMAEKEYLVNFKNENNIPDLMKEGIFNFCDKHLG